ncbi:hypothetical protein ACIQ6Y_16225 [Streptomyces sp. NPDC096205]|uniref:hypothetical protein n=1 Tax=Streptomyces sp. NPDC096205 TaxID=3366081 RepID=UPI0037F8B0DF
MGPALVFVHGTGAPRDPDAERASWLAALPFGARRAGHSRQACSPIGMRTVVLPRPPATPDRVERWLNAWDRDDIIALRPLLERASA